MTTELLRVVALLALSVALSQGGPASAAPSSAGHAAACVAALKGQESSLAATLKSGAAVETELFRVVRSGVAIIGRQYLAGLREAEARQLLDSAERDFRALSPDSRRLRQARCLVEGERIYAEASALERGFISTAARKRVERVKSR